MQKLIVRNFGPVQELDLEVKDLMLFIGEQATGKSTVAKLIFFFRSLRDDLITYLYNNETIPTQQLALHFLKSIKHKFSPRFFGSTKHLPSFYLKFKYKNGTYLQITTNDEHIVNVTFTDTINNSEGISTYGELAGICRQIQGFRRQYFGRNTALLSTNDFRRIESEKRRRQAEIEESINLFFGNIRDTLFIPAGRSLLSTLSEQLPALETYNVDFLMRAFLERISRLKPAFAFSLAELIEEKIATGVNVPSRNILDFAVEKVREVLKGEYRYDRLGEKIYFDEENYIKLSMASSGQQEAVWILLQLFMLILNRENVFLVIEEPEAHLFPQAQKSLVELIALLFNENNTQILITTHSPYILTAFNNLIYAGNVGQQHEEVDGVISNLLWLDSEKVGAFRLRSGGAENLMDEENSLMRVEEIDTISQSINADFDAILNLELQ